MLVVLEGHLLGLRQQRLHLAEVQKRVTVVALLDDAGDYVAFPAGVLLVLEVALGFADPLEDHLLGRLCRYPAEVLRGVVPLPDDSALFVQFLAIDPYLAGIGLDGDHGLLCGTGHPLVGGDESVGESVQQDINTDAFVLGYLL